MERPHLERLRGRREDLVRKLELTSLAMQKRNEGQSLSREEKSLIDSEADTTLLLGEYKEIFEHLNNNLTNNNTPGMSASLPDELRSLVSLLYFGSLFQVLDEEEVAECDSHIGKERGKINKDKHDLSGITEVVQKIVPHLESGCLGRHLELVNSCYTSFVEKSEEPEIRELVHMLVTSDQFCTRKGFHQKDERKKKWLGGTLHEWIKDYKEDVVKILSFKAGESKLEKPRLTDVGRHIIRGITKKLLRCHLNGITFRDLRSEDIILDEKLNVVAFEGIQCGSGDTNFKTDCVALRAIFSELLSGNLIPDDVGHLMSLLGEYNRDNEDIIFHHSCLWTPIEMVKNVFLFRLEMAMNAGTRSIWDAADNTPEEIMDWTFHICKHPVYKRALDAWVEEMRQKSSGKEEEGELQQNPNLSYVDSKDVKLLRGAKLLSFMRMCFVHMFQHARAEEDARAKARLSQAIAKKKVKSFQKSKPPKIRSWQQTERELYVAFPLYIPHFLEETKSEELIKGIYRSYL